MNAKKTPAAVETTTSAMHSAIVAEQHDGGNPTFTPRQARALAVLLPGQWIARETMDRATGASNAPDVIHQLRRKLGYDAIEMERLDATDRDGKPCRPGRYRLTQQGRERLAQINATTDQWSAAA